ncbi:MAG: ChbG/HpnK family deacetylase [Planctomycetota bacterium]
MMDKRLIINADDFGLSKGVNKGIVEAHTKGVLTSATIMVNMPAAEQAVELTKKLPNLGVGVHLNLTNGKPVSRDQSVKLLLNTEGNFGLSAGKLALASLVTGKVRAAIEAELSAQIQWVIERGIKPTHLDSHKHIHAFPLIFRIVCRLAKRLGIPAIRYAYEPKQVCRPPWPFTDRDGRKRASLVRTMAKITRWQNRSFFRTDALFGVAHTGKINPTFLRAVALYNQAATAELMTHPGYTYDLDATQTRLVKQREVELEVLCSEKTKQCFKDAGVKLVHYGRL